MSWIEAKNLFIELVILVWTMDLADFKTQTRMISLFCHFFSCINTVYSLFYIIHTEKVNGLIHFFGSFTLFDDGEFFPCVLVESKFLRDEEHKLGFRFGGYIVMIHAFMISS